MLRACFFSYPRKWEVDALAAGFRPWIPPDWHGLAFIFSGCVGWGGKHANVQLTSRLWAPRELTLVSTCARQITGEIQLYPCISINHGICPIRKTFAINLGHGCRVACKKGDFQVSTIPRSVLHFHSLICYSVVGASPIPVKKSDDVEHVFLSSSQSDLGMVSPLPLYPKSITCHMVDIAPMLYIPLLSHLKWAIHSVGAAENPTAWVGS